MTEPLDQLPDLRLPLEVAGELERRAVDALRAAARPRRGWWLRLERWALQGAALGYLGWAFARVFLG